MIKLKKISCIIVSLLIGFMGTNLVAAKEDPTLPPSVVASITPFYNLVAAVMEGVGKPQLLVKVGSSPHDYALKPSEAKLLQKADIIFWAGPELESFLTKPLGSIPLKSNAQVISLIKIPNLKLYETRKGSNWLEDHHHHHDDKDHHHSHDLGSIDMHFWLDPKNAIILIETITEILSKADPYHKQQYEKNSENFKLKLKKLDFELKTSLKTIQKVPFIVFHDAYQYFDDYYSLNNVGAIALHPGIPPSVHHLKEIRKIIEKTKTVCIFSEPQFQPKAVDLLAQDLNVKKGELDPLGKILSSEGYFLLLQDLSDSLISCLKKN